MFENQQKFDEDGFTCPEYLLLFKSEDTRFILYFLG